MEVKNESQLRQMAREMSPYSPNGLSHKYWMKGFMFAVSMLKIAHMVYHDKIEQAELEASEPSHYPTYQMKPMIGNFEWSNITKEEYDDYQLRHGWEVRIVWNTLKN